jgi:hypothetical protein
VFPVLAPLIWAVFRSSTPNLGRVSGSSTPYLGNTPNLGSLRTDNASGTVSDSGLTTNSPVRAGLEEIEEVTEKATSEDVASSKADLSGTICN